MAVIDPALIPHARARSAHLQFQRMERFIQEEEELDLDVYRGPA